LEKSVSLLDKTVFVCQYSIMYVLSKIFTYGSMSFFFENPYGSMWQYGCRACSKSSVNHYCNSVCSLNVIVTVNMNYYFFSCRYCIFWEMKGQRHQIQAGTFATSTTVWYWKMPLFVLVLSARWQSLVPLLTRSRYGDAFRLFTVFLWHCHSCIFLVHIGFLYLRFSLGSSFSCDDACLILKMK
jgi:hypothetical protein